MKGHTILGWNLTLEEHVTHINLGSPKIPQLVRISFEASDEFFRRADALFCKYKDVFTWNYRNMRGILPSICEHCIELEE